MMMKFNDVCIYDNDGDNITQIYSFMVVVLVMMMRNVMTSWDIDNDDGNDNDSYYYDDEDILIRFLKMITNWFFFSA